MSVLDRLLWFCVFIATVLWLRHARLFLPILILVTIYPPLITLVLLFLLVEIAIIVTFLVKNPPLSVTPRGQVITPRVLLYVFVQCLAAFSPRPAIILYFKILVLITKATHASLRDAAAGSTNLADADVSQHDRKTSRAKLPIVCDADRQDTPNKVNA